MPAFPAILPYFYFRVYNLCGGEKGFLFNHGIWVSFEKIFVIKDDVPDNVELKVIGII